MRKLSRVERKKRRRKIFLIILFTLIVGTLILMFMLNSELFSVKTIKVKGNKKVETNKIALFSSIQKGENIFKFSTKDAESGIIELPYIKDANLNRKLPNQIVINVEERKENIKIKDASSFIILDKEGYILDNREDADESLTEIIGLNIANKNIGYNIFLESEEKTKVDFLEESDRLDMIKLFKIIRIEDIKNVNILTFNEIEVVFGSASNVKYKLDLLNEVLKDIEKKDLKAKMILMDKGDNPVVVLEEDSEEG